MTVSKLASQIKRLRLERGWTQERLGLEANVSTRTVIAYEQSPKGFDIVAKLADALGVELVVRLETL